MKNNRVLNEQELATAIGAGIGISDYCKEVYHSAGFITDYSIIRQDRFYLILDANGSKSLPMNTEQANMFVDYYLNNSIDQYLKFIHIFYPEADGVYRGHDQ